jgi:hypothetical protein
MRIFEHLKGRFNLNTIRSELRRLAEKKQVVRVSHGFYRIRISPDILYFIEHPPTLLHGIMVSMDSLKIRKLQNGIHGIPADSCVWDDLERMGFELRGNGRFVKKYFFDDDPDRMVTLTVHGSVGRVDVYLRCSNHPVNYFEFVEILSYSKAFVGVLRPFVSERVVQFGMGKDFREVRLEGLSCLSLRVFRDSWLRVYNKERLGVTRVEQHVRCNVGTDVFVSLFERMFLPVGNGVVHKEDDFCDVQ